MVAGVGDLLARADEFRRIGDLAGARHAYRAAVRAAEEAGDQGAFVAAALGLGGLWVFEQRDVLERADVEALWQRAAAACPAGSLDAARLAARRAAEGVYTGEPASAVEDAVDAIRAFGDDTALAEGLSLLHHVRLGPSHAAERLEIAEEIIRLAARAGDDLLALMGLCWRTVDLFLLGDGRARQSLQELRERSTRDGVRAVAFIVEVLDATLLARSGRLAEAEAASAAAMDEGVSLGDPDALAYHGAMLAAVRWWQGRAGEVIDLVRAVSSSPRLGPNDHVYVAADALLSASLDDRESAEEALARLTGLGLKSVPDSSSWLTTQFLVVEAAFRLGAREVAAEAAALLRPYADLPVMPSLAVVCLGSVHRTLGLAAIMADDLERAAEELEAAIEVDRRLGSRPMTALTEHALALVDRQRGRDDEAEVRQRRAEERARSMGIVLPPDPDWLPRARLALIGRVPNGWELQIGDRRALLADRVGFAYLSTLVARPGREVDVLALAAGIPAVADPVLDRQAIQEYRRRAAELEHTAAPGDPELAALRDVLRRATGLGDRVRAFPTDRERARTAVRKALTRAVGAIGAIEPDLGHHLEASLVTGGSCRYTPGADWRLQAI